MLSLSWAPDFCAHAEGRGAFRECDPSRHTGFIAHGLWPEREYGRPLEDCEPVRPVSAAIVDSMLPIMPDRGLIQHEWRLHGSCSGMPPREYFGMLRQAFGRVRIPHEFVSGGHRFTVTVPELQDQIARESGLPHAGIRIACRDGELSEIRVCFTKELQGRACGESVRGCRSERVSVLPVE